VIQGLFCRRTTIKISDFITIFRDAGIRSWFDWELLQSPSYSVVQIFSRSVSDISRFETVWYSRPDGSLGDWRNQEDRRISVRDAATRQAFPNKESEDYIQRLISDMRAASTPPYLVLPCYRTQDRKVIILDGNHRAVAAFRSATDVRLLVFAISGPDHPLLLPDLLHEISSETNAELWAQYRAEIEQKFGEN
jgi:hypothetical protein